MTSDASVGGNGRLRLFCALRLPGGVLDSVVRWQQDLALPGRVVPRENLHLTLAFLGSHTQLHRPSHRRRAACGLRSGRADLPPGVRLPGRAARPGCLPWRTRAGRPRGWPVTCTNALHGLGIYEPDKRPWLPHLTTFRFREKPRLRPPLPALGRVCPSDAALYNSLLRSTGAQYVVMATLALGGS